MTITSSLGPDGYTVSIQSPVSGGGADYSAGIDCVIVGDSMTAVNALVTGVSAASRSGGVVTATVTGHGMANGMTASFRNMVPNDFNANSVAVTRIDANTLQYSAPGADGAAASLSAQAAMIMLNGSRQPDSGYFFWLQSLSGGAFRMVRNAGANGQTSAHMLERYERDVLSVSAGLDIIRTGFNDFYWAGYTAAQVSSNVQEMAAKSIAAGRRVLIVGAIPWTGATTTAKTNAAAYNRRMSRWALNTPGARFADAAARIVDATNAAKFSALSGMLLSDGVHESPKGARETAAAIWAVLQSETPRIQRLVSSNADNYGSINTSLNVLDDCYWTSSGGNVTAPATGAAASGVNVTASATGSVVASVVSRSDGIGYNQRIVCTPSANNDWGMIGQNANMAISRVTLGGKIQLVCEVKKVNVSGSNLKGINIQVFFNGASVYTYAVQAVATSANEYPQVDETMTVVSPEMSIPLTATSFNWSVQALYGAAGSACTIELGRGSIEKLA